MPKFHVPMIVIGHIFACTISFAQGESALPFLLISPYTEANGMGEASVAIYTDDPLALMTNPAHLGMQSQSKYFSSGYNYADWLPAFKQANLWLRTFAFTTGINLKKALAIEPEISIGLAYSQVYLNLGEFTVTRDDPTPLGTFKGYEKSDQYSLGVGLNYGVKVSAGMTFKQVFSSLGVSGLTQQGGTTVSVNTYDYGLFVNVPVVGIISQVREEPIQFSPSISPFFDFNIGVAKNNLGDEEVMYSNIDQSDPLPRHARAGIGFDFGITYTRNDVELQALSFKWTIEANDVLVRPYGAVMDSAGNVIQPGGWEYQSGLGDINFFDEVILGKTNPKTVQKRGWELNLFKIFFIRGGRFEEDYNYGNRNFSTSGYGVQLEGILNFLRTADDPLATSDVFDFIANHVNIRYNHSEITTDERNHPLSGTTFNSINLFIAN